MIHVKYSVLTVFTIFMLHYAKHILDNSGDTVSLYATFHALIWVFLWIIFILIWGGLYWW